jgi:hypothetical protein
MRGVVKGASPPGPSPFGRGENGCPTPPTFRGEGQRDALRAEGLRRYTKGMRNLIVPRLLPIVLCLLALALLLSAAHAGGGPENAAVVINADSWASMTVANEFIHLRHIPAGNVVYLTRVGDIEQTNVETFREKILRPVLAQLEQRGLAAQIDYLVYSSDLPTQINISSDLQDQHPKIITPYASINGLTYLCGYVLSKAQGYAGLTVNRYARRPLPVLGAQVIGDAQRPAYTAAHKLIGEKKWAEAIQALQQLEKDLPRAPEVLYNLACCLAQANRGDEAVAALRRAVDAGYLNFATVEADDDLKALRGRDDYQKLVAAMKTRVFEVQPTRGFRSSYAWDEKGEVTAQTGPHYLLSTVLAVTSGRGNSVAEAVADLRSSVAADGTRPAGTVYYMVNGDIRSRVRQWAFAPAIAKLKEAGVAAQTLDGALPPGKSDVAGAMVGIAGFEWAKSGSKILPGAICEHLTSYGGMMMEGAGQTPLTEFIRYGAAGASGTVTEPFAIQEKFPDPFIQVHYARGCTLAEAFYQSVPGPYQLLIVGDPLCRPWARIPAVTLEGATAGATVQGQVMLHPKVKSEPAVTVAHFEVFVDGRRMAVCLPDGVVRLDTAKLPDGYHAVSVVAVTNDAIETRGEITVPLTIANGGRRLSVDAPADPKVKWGETVKLWAKLAGASAIHFAHNMRLLASVQGEEGEVSIDTRLLGLGPVQLQAVGIVGDAKTGQRVVAAPVELTVVAPDPLPALPPQAGAHWAPGLQVVGEGAKPVLVETTAPADWLVKAGIKDGQKFTVKGSFDLPATETCQFQIATDCDASMSVDGKAVEFAPADGWRMAPVVLAAGMHRLDVQGTAHGKLRLGLRFGGPGAMSIGAPRFRHTVDAG